MTRVSPARHGIALDPADRGAPPDDDRPLTAKGRRRFRRVARAFAQMGEEADLLFTSPLIRAAQTAELLARKIRQDGVGGLEEPRARASAGPLLADGPRRGEAAQSAAR